MTIIKNVSISRKSDGNGHDDQYNEQLKLLLSQAHSLLRIHKMPPHTSSFTTTTTTTPVYVKDVQQIYVY